MALPALGKDVQWQEASTEGLHDQPFIYMFVNLTPGYLAVYSNIFCIHSNVHNMFICSEGVLQRCYKQIQKPWFCHQVALAMSIHMNWVKPNAILAWTSTWLENSVFIAMILPLLCETHWQVAVLGLYWIWDIKFWVSTTLELTQIIWCVTS